jgi:glycolate oxidase iron-sulfur subunit
MQTALADFIRDTPEGREADNILRACVHCGFCTATCPTYQLLGDELDGPRGRIYQIKLVLEGQPASTTVRNHLDRCLTCRACETTCPSGVNYHRLVDIGRQQVERQVPRSLPARALRRALIEVLAYRRRFGPLLRIGQALRPLMPGPLKRKIPARSASARPSPVLRNADRQVLLLDGCVQPALAPEINLALERLLNSLGVTVIPTPQAGCCGAVPHHLNNTERAKSMARRNIDAWHPLLERGAEAVLVTASGCGAHLADYPHLLADDPVYAERAEELARAALDPVEFLTREDLSRLPLDVSARRVAVHTPCTLQHALKLNGAVETLLDGLGYRLCQVDEGHLCCGSAGTYSILQADLSGQLRDRKLRALSVDHPDLIATANIGCLTHLDQAAGIPVRHWLTVLADDLRAG